MKILVLVLGLAFMLTSFGVINQDNKIVTNEFETELVQKNVTIDSKTPDGIIHWSDWGPWSNEARGCGERMRIGIEIGNGSGNLIHREVQRKKCPADKEMHDPAGQE